VEKGSPESMAHFNKLPKENNRPIGENSPNLVILRVGKRWLSNGHNYVRENL
jgi:hypothetical protein